MYEKNYKMERFYTDKHKNLLIGQVFHFLNDIMEYNADSYGAGEDYHIKRDLAWVLVEYDITIHQLPVADQEVIIGTLPYSFKRMFGYRVYHFKDLNGTLLIEGKAKFVLINIKTKELVKPDKALLSLFKDAHQEPVALPFDKVEATKSNLLYQKKTQVLHTHIDVNEHMNNAYYVDLAYNFLDEDTLKSSQIKRIKVAYKKEALINENLFINYYLENNGLLADITNGKDTFCTVYFIK
ncbi:MAG: acyl-[acyl-carrier-protein] thioesterase [Candidatus Izemoplasmataceae bacterium]|jgi:medium-chain acyl-[acyl-carrier-protein] hydrolase|uniref:acyl-[acyl-carrier-protein] thioesterase n=1 Tax=Liberiplasma polymorphum TaxID=3374570 RepID=UPI003774185F